MMRVRLQNSIVWRHARLWAVFAGLVFLLILGVWSPGLQKQYENMLFAMMPTASRAAEYGTKHFDAQQYRSYDIQVAEHFYKEAAALDPQYPYVYHQLARIAFLRGEFDDALALINKQISLHGDTAPKSYYIRALIEGYGGDYAAAAKDYEHYLTFAPVSWAAHNDYAWVLLKANRPQDAVKVTTDGLVYFPNNPWLLNTNATALYETGDLAGARTAAEAAVRAAETLTEKEWLTAYPGNDPHIAQAGIAAFKKATLDNMHTIELALASGAVQSR